MKLAFGLAMGVAGAWLAWPRDPVADAPVAPSNVERTTLSPNKMAEPPFIDVAKKDEPPHELENSTVVTSDTSEWARRLATRGNRRDLDAVIETFQDSMQCHHYHDAVDHLQAINNNPRNQDLTKLNLSALDRMDESIARIQAIINRANALCEGSDRIAVNRAYQRAMLDAAQRGDPDAQTCYLRNGGGTRYWSPQEYQRMIGARDAEYRRSFTKAGLERADPYIGYWELYRYLRATEGETSPSDPGNSFPDIVRLWEVARLASLRAPPELRLRVENMLGRAAERALISPEDIASADAWAQATWEKEFSDQPPFDFDRYGACSPHGWH